MANFDRLELLPAEQRELLLCKRSAPFRLWFAVKAINNECRFYNSRRSANAFARAHAPAKIYAAQ